MNYQHTPVLLQEALTYLELKPGQSIIDCTIGGAGHSQEILKAVSPGGQLIGFDMDPEAIKTSEDRLAKIGKDNFQLINDSFINIDKHVTEKVDGILLDLGISSYELENAGRGFSFQAKDEPLDMRMNPQDPTTAAFILNNYSEQQIKNILKEFGEELFAKQIARRVVIKRKTKKFETVEDLLKIVEQVYQNKRKPKIHIATKTWQALRIEVNDEINNLKVVLPKAIKLLKKNGKLIVISFHSLEDREVKHFFKKQSLECVCPPEFPVCKCDHEKQLEILTRKPATPSPEEIKNNPRSRSAKLRAIKKI